MLHVAFVGILLQGADPQAFGVDRLFLGHGVGFEELRELLIGGLFVSGRFESLFSTWMNRRKSSWSFSIASMREGMPISST
jgi:hypothetical protein